MSKEEINYEQDVQIDERNLHVEWLEQSELTMKYIRHANELQKQKDRAEKKLNYVSADLGHKMKNDPDKYGLVKATDSEVKNAVIIHKDYQKALEEYNELKFEAKQAWDALEDIKDRKWILQELDRLMQIGYFAPPTSPKDIESDAKAVRSARSKKKNESVQKKTNQSRVQRKTTTQNKKEE